MPSNDNDLSPERVLELRQMLLGAIVDPSRAIEREDVAYSEIGDAALRRAIERGHAYEDEPFENRQLSFVRLLVAGGHGVSSHIGDISMLLQAQAQAFQTQHDLTAEQMIAVLALVLGRYSGLAALAAMGK